MKTEKFNARKALTRAEMKKVTGGGGNLKCGQICAPDSINLCGPDCPVCFPEGPAIGVCIANPN